jgi:hypothetical protein
MSTIKPTFGVHSSYVPVEFPKAGTHENKKTAVALTAEHQRDLEKAGFVFPVFVSSGEPQSNVTVGGVSSAYIAKEYPKALNGPGGKTVLAKNPDHETELGKQGWREKPYPVETAVDAARTTAVASTATVDAVVKEHMQLQNEHIFVKAQLEKVQNENADMKELIETAKPQSNVGLSKALRLLQKDLDDARASKADPAEVSDLKARNAGLQSDVDRLTGEIATLVQERTLLLEMTKPTGASA